MTRWLAAARRAEEAGTKLTKPTEPRPSEVMSVMSVLSEREKPQAAQVARRVEPDPNADAFPYGTACDLGDAPRTWTGRVVSLAAWKRLTEWERHGPNGRVWCGLCRCRHMPNACHGKGNQS
jgi:hypothetical protein